MQISQDISGYLFGVNSQMFTRFVKIRESATRRAILPMDLSLLPWWDVTYMLQILLIYTGMKLINTLYLSHLFCIQCLAGKACPTGDTSLPFCFTKQGFCSKLLRLLCCMLSACRLLRLSCVCSFRLQYLFPSCLFSPASKKNRDTSTFNTWK